MYVLCMSHFTRKGGLTEQFSESFSLFIEKSDSITCLERRGGEPSSHQGDATKTVCNPWSQGTTHNKPSSK